MQHRSTIWGKVSVDGLEKPLRCRIYVSINYRYFLTFGVRGKGCTVAYLQGNPREGFRLPKSEIDKVMPVCSDGFLQSMLENVQ